MKLNRRFRILVGLAAMVQLLSFASTARAQVRVDELYAFPAEFGPATRSELIQASDGNFYGTAHEGYAGGRGAVFRITPAGDFAVVHAFAGENDGANPLAALVQGSDGYLYGTTQQGGPGNFGTIFKMTLGGAMTILRAFDGAMDGTFPNTPLIQAADGNFYGATHGSDTSGAYGSVMLRMTPSRSITVLHGFQGSSDTIPDRLVQAQDGNFYGAMRHGGIGYGTIFRMTPSGMVTVLHTFTGGTGGGEPVGALVEGIDGYLYGTTRTGGIYGRDTAFRMTLSGSVTTLRSFSEATGFSVEARLIRSSNGFLYGVTRLGGTFNRGTLFRLTPDGDLTVLHSFTAGTDGASPTRALVQGADGSLYGIVPSFGRFQSGVALRVAVSAVPTTAATQLVMGSRPGSSPVVRVITATDDRTLQAFDPAFLGGVNVTLGDVNGDGTMDIITAAGPGGGPHIRVFSGTDLGELHSFFAYSPAFQGGVSVAAGDVNGDGRTDIVTGAGPGGGPHVRVFSGRDLSDLASFYAYDPVFPGGVSVAAGDIDGDGGADIITGAGPGGGPHVRVFSGVDRSALTSFFAYDPAFQGGVSVAAGDINGDGRTDLITGAGPGGDPHVRVFSGVDLNELASFLAFTTRSGVSVGSTGDQARLR